MNNQSALDRLKEIEAEKVEIEAALLKERENVEFPIYCQRGYNEKCKIISKHKSITIIRNTNAGIATHADYTESGVTCTDFDCFLRGETTPITPEEFEAACSEAINKLSNL